MNEKWATEEMETIVNISRVDDVVRIWTNIPSHVRAFSRRNLVTTVKTGNENGQPWGEFTIAKENYSPVTGIKRAGRKLTEEQRQVMAKRLEKARGAKNGSE